MPAVVIGLGVVALLALFVVYLFVVMNFTISWGLHLALAGVIVGCALAVVRAVLVLVDRDRSVRVVSPEDVYRPELRSGGHDYAWPHYLTGQVGLDAQAIVGATVVDVRRLWRIVFWTAPVRLARRILPYDYDEPRYWIAPIALTWPLLLVIAAGLLGVSAGAGIGLGIVLLAFAGVTAAGYVAGAIGIGVLRGFDRIVQRRRAAEATCPSCTFTSSLPTFRCPGLHDQDPEKSELHRELRPGRLGIWRRRCGCGTLLPSTLARASAALDTVCPLCDGPMFFGAGVATAIRISVFGAVGAGKTTWLRAAASGTARLPALTGVFKRSGPFELIALAGRRGSMGAPAHVLVVDTPGMALLDRSGYDYRQFESAQGLVFIFDPLAATQTPSGVSGQEEAYQTIARRLNAAAPGTCHQRLAVVVAKADMVSTHEPEKAPGSSQEAIRQWLWAREDNLVLSAERDFGEVRYFLSSNLDSAADPAAALRWLLAVHKVKLDVAEAPADAR
jgi:hypothetical protein